jgi:hypothetical protein
VQHSQEADRRSQAFGITCNAEQRFRRGTKQDGVDLARILQRKSSDLLRQCKNDVEVRDRQQFGIPRCEPFCARGRLTLWTVPVAA